MMYESVKTYERRSPHGERGLKGVDCNVSTHSARKSLSSRRAWIERLGFVVVLIQITSRSPHGERGLKVF